MRNKGTSLSLILLLVSLQFTIPTVAQPPSNAGWNKILHTYVNAQGLVNYPGLVKDSTQLYEYCSLLESHPPQSSWTRDQRLAFWINAYNAFTLKLVVSHYPLKSIRDLNPTIKIPEVNTIWKKDFFNIGNQAHSLDDIESGILRSKFNEPRIHFAINCASHSCPALRNEAYEADKIDQQLTEQARRFINDPTRNRISSEHIQISRIFQWFRGDFTKNGSLIDFLNKYSRVQINPNASIDYLDYDWSLNKQ